MIFNICIISSFIASFKRLSSCIGNSWFHTSQVTSTRRWRFQRQRVGLCSFHRGVKKKETRDCSRFCLRGQRSRRRWRCISITTSVACTCGFIVGKGRAYKACAAYIALVLSVTGEKMRFFFNRATWDIQHFVSWILMCTHIFF